jgi:photosynthetic reaction center cytochrome c subunit
MNSRVASLALVAMLILGCTANTTQPQSQPPAVTPNPAGYKNLKVLPHDITRDQLLAVMRTFTRSLGVRCNHCHVVTATEPKEVLDFPADTKEEKRVARVMIQMTQQINKEWLARVEQAEGHAAESAAAPAPATSADMRVGCWTCHRGKSEPDMPPPPPPPAPPSQ